MATKKGRSKPAGGTAATRTSSPIDKMLLAALERGDDSLETGRYLVTFKEGAAKEGVQSLGVQEENARCKCARFYGPGGQPGECWGR
ncbi:MAG: hypothetical protein ACR2G5_15990 [Pyrinomonadaceae bacterium]